MDATKVLTIRATEILLVEDNPGDVRLTREAFRDGKLTNQLAVAGDGEEALALLRRKPPYEEAARPDLILLDLNLPKLNGQEVLDQLHADPTLAQIPVVALTASDDEHDVLRSLHPGATACLTKPVDVRRLLALVRRIDSLAVSIVLPGGI